jgi:hypothetical protein
LLLAADEKKAPDRRQPRGQKGANMQTTNTILKSKSQTAGTMPLRAIIEIIDGELKIYPIGNSDRDEKTILDALREGL